jgi:tetratricopeptide (TPR) repeat protein
MAMNHRSISLCAVLALFLNSPVLFTQEALSLEDASKKEANTCVSRAQANFKLGRNKAVIADCTKAIQLDPKNLGAYELRASALFKTGPYESSVADWKTAVSLDPKAERLWRGLGLALSKTYDHEAVIAEMTRAINSGVKTLEIYKIRADALYKEEQYKRCAEDLTVILTKFNTADKWKRWDYLKLRARSYLRNKEYAKAEKDCTEALIIAPDDSKSYFARADAREHLGKYKEAVQDLTSVIKYDPNDGRAFSIRGKIYEHLGQQAKADSDRKAAIKLGDKQWGI